MHWSPNSCFPRLYRYGTKPTSHDWIKAIAIFFMIIDHVGKFVFPEQLWLRAIGRAAAPLFFFATGYAGNYRFKADILGYAILLTLSTLVFENQLFANILFNFVFIKWVLNQPVLVKFIERNLIVSFLFSLIFQWLTAGYLEYGAFGILFSVGAYLLSQQDRRGIYWLGLSLLLYFIYQGLVFDFAQSSVCLSIFGVMSLGLFFLFYGYRLLSWNFGSVLNFISMFLGRYSLEIYVFHLLCFQWVGWMRIYTHYT